MKYVKRFFIVICVLVVLLGGVITICAFNPGISDSLASVLYGKDTKEQETGSLSGETGMTGEESPGQENVTEGITGEGSKEQLDNEAEQFPQTSVLQMPYPDAEKYVSPTKEKITAPSAVGGKVGYVPVKGKSLEIWDKEGEELQKNADYGQTGEDLTFDTKFYPYYGMLDGNLQKLYRQIYANTNAVKQVFQPVIPVTTEQLKFAFEAVYNDHPELFWLEPGYSCRYTKDGRCREISLQFNSIADNLETAKEAFNSSAAVITDVAQKLATDYQKEKYVHDTLIGQVEYNLAADANQSAYSALVGGQSVCAGYSRAFQYLMQQLEIPCYYCTGYSGQNHAWNIIQLEDGYYNVDATWDDTEPNTYNYFNQTDEDVADTHIRQNLSIYLPACNGEKYRNMEEAIREKAEAAEKEEDSRRSLEDLGLKEEDVIRDMTAYYKECYDYCMRAGIGNVEFQCVIPEELWEVVEQAYSSRAYEAGYTTKVMEELGANHCGFQIDGEVLQDDYYLLRHNITVSIQ